MQTTFARTFLPIAFLGLTLLTQGCGASPNLVSTLPTQALQASARAVTPILKTYTAGQTPGFPLSAYAFDITLGPKGAMWFTDGGSAPAVGKITAGGTVAEYSKGLLRFAKPFAIVNGADGRLWFSDFAGRIGRVTPDGKIKEFAVIPASVPVNPTGIVAARNGGVWSIAKGPPDLLIRADSSGALTTYRVPKKYTADGSLAIDASGNLWMMVLLGQKGIMLERTPHGEFVEHQTGLIHADVLCCPNYAPERITIGPDGNPWFTTLQWLRNNSGKNYIGTMMPTRTVFFPVDQSVVGMTAFPSGIATMGGHVWFTGDNPFNVGGGIWRIDENGAQRGFAVPNSAMQLAPDGNGDLWFTAEGFDHPAQIVEAITPH
jgi:streptogramin lyase